MADVKISGLPASTVPLAGTEVLPIVQGGTTKQVSIANVTAGRAISATTIQSTVATGTAPLTVASTTEVANLRAANATSADTANQVKSNATTGVLQVVGPATAATRVMTTPDANFTVARTDAGQTFTGVNTFTSPKIITDISDTNGNELLKVTATASAVNEITVANAATGNNPVLSATGSDTNIGITLTPKGTGDAVLTSGNLVIGTSGKGIDFSATAGTGTSELFNDYEEGTWTPTITNASLNATMSGNNFGTYTKIGRLVTVQMYVETTSVAAIGAGAIYISGWPFSITTSGGSCASTGSGLNIGANQNITLSRWAGTLARIAKWDATTGTSFMTVPQWTDDGAAYWTMSYET
jgi:hypothetical protein